MTWKQSLIQLIDSRIQIAIRGGRRRRKPRAHVMATIDPDYSSGRPSVIMEGDRSDLPIGPFPYLSTYSPQPGDRVLMAQAGSKRKYVILGKIE